METATVPEINMTALERKWAEEAVNKPPALDDAYSELGFDPEKLDQAVIDTIPQPTGWRIAILPYRGAEKSKGGIVERKHTTISGKWNFIATPIGDTNTDKSDQTEHNDRHDHLAHFQNIQRQHCDSQKGNN